MRYKLYSKNGFFVFACAIMCGTLSPSFSWAWGGRGHANLCEAAIFSLQKPQLREYLQSKMNVMTHLCNIPDTYWRSLKGDDIKLGSSSHFIDTDMLGLPISKIPADFSVIERDFTGRTYGSEGKTIRSVALDFGTLWWRIDQFHRRNLLLAQKIKGTPAPKADERTDESHPYVKSVNEFIESIGTMGHFVGDLSQPFHSATDYDGWDANHGGIHAYYEEVVVAHFDEKLLEKVVREARKLRANKKIAFLKEESAVERARALSEISFADLAAVLKADELVKPSSQKDEKGLKLRTPAERKPLGATFKKFEPLVVTHLARGAALLSLFWEDAYKASGEPNFEVAKSYWFPFTPAFLPVDYTAAPASSSKKD
jgi:hypothetical protein